MKLKIITFCLLFVMILFSCKKEDLSSNAKFDALLLRSILIDNQSSHEYLYNDDKQVVGEESKFDFTKHYYNDKGQLITNEYYGKDDMLNGDLNGNESALNSNELVTQITGKKDGAVTFEYNDNDQLIKTSFSNPVPGGSESSEFSYNANNKISRQTMYWENTARGYVDYSFDAKGNLVKEMLYDLPANGIAELITTTQYYFDNEHNPFQGLSKLRIPGIYTNRNNIIKETYTIHLSPNQSSDNVQTTEFSYEYNAMGYPVNQNDNVYFVYN